MKFKYRKYYFFVLIAIILFSIYLLINKKNHSTSNNNSQSEINVENQEEDTSAYGLIQSDFFNLESAAGLQITSTIKEGKSFSGNKSCYLSDRDEYSVTYAKEISSLRDFKNLRKIIFKMQLFSESNLQNSFIVLDIKSAAGNSLDWQGVPIVAVTNQWVNVEADFTIKKKLLQKGNLFKLYVWKKDKKPFYVDDLEIFFNGIGGQLKREEKKAAPEIKLSNFFYDFESQTELSNSALIATDKAHSGKQSIRLDAFHKYGPVLKKQRRDVSLHVLKSVSLSAWFYSLENAPEIILVTSATDAAGKEYSWNGKSTQKNSFEKNSWFKVNAEFNLPPEKDNPENKISVYVWDKGGSAVYMDDFEVVFHEEKPPYAAPPNVVIDPFKEFQYTPQKNKPPYRISYFEKCDIGNHEGVFLADDQERAGELFPEDQFVVGNFFGETNKLDELFCINQAQVGLFGYCTDEKKFKIIWTEQDREEIKNWNAGHFVRGDFNNDGKDELLRMGKNIKTQLLHLSGDNKNNSCKPASGKSAWEVLWEDVAGKIADWKIEDGDEYMGGDFKGDGNYDLLLIHPTSREWMLLRYHDDKWWPRARSNSQSKFQSLSPGCNIGTFNYKKKDLLFLNTLNHGESNLTFYEYNSATKNFRELQLSEKIDTAFFPCGCEFWFDHFEGRKEKQLLIYNKRWRFDLKLASIDSKGLTINSTVDFKGFVKDQNPKYYELLKIIPGNFISRSTTSIITVLRNSAVKNNDGVHAEKYRTVKELPDHVQLYKLSNKLN